MSRKSILLDHTEMQKSMIYGWYRAVFHWHEEQNAIAMPLKEPYLQNLQKASPRGRFLIIGIDYPPKTEHDDFGYRRVQAPDIS